MLDLEKSLRGKRVLVTGGLGMIGSAIANKLVRFGAFVTLADACIEPYGANMFNVKEIRHLIQISITDIRDKESIKFLVKEKDIIFNLAGQVSHNDSIDNPFLDAEINYFGQLNVIENVRRYNPEAILLFPGSRLQFGRIESNPVNENHPLRPRTPYALNKTAAENMYLFYHGMYDIPSIIFRIANPYGLRSQMKHFKYSMVNWFIRTAMEGKCIKIFGNGEQIRDYIYVEDLADAFLLASVEPKCSGEVYNIGSGQGTKFREMVEMIIDVVGNGKVEYVPWPDNYINVETGDYITDVGKICKAIPWKPQTGLREGIQQTFEYYRENRSHYWQ